MQVQNPTRILVRSTELLVLVVLIAAAIYVSIGRLLVSASQFYRTDLEQLLESQYAVPVHMGPIEGEWNYFNPILRISDIRVGDPQSPALIIDTASVQVSSLYSLTSGNLIISDIDVHRVQLALEERVPGKWNIVGLKGSDKPVNLDLILDSLPHLNVVRFMELSVDLDGLRADFHLGHIENEPIELLAHDGIKTFIMPISLSRADQRGVVEQLRLVGDYRGDVRKSDYSGEFYLNVSQVEIFDFVEPFHPDLGHLTVGGEIWADIDGNNVEVTGSINAQSTYQHDANQFDISGRLVFGVTGSPGQYLFSGREVTLQTAGREIHLSGLHGVLEREETTTLGIVLPQLVLGEITNVLEHIGEASTLLPDNIRLALEQTSPSGIVHSVLATTEIQPQSPVASIGDSLSELRIVGLLDDVNVNAYRGSPGFSGLDGLVSLGSDSGYIDVLSEQFELFFQSSFANPWPFTSAAGRVNYRLGEEGVHLSSGLVELLSGELSAYGKLAINLLGPTEMHNWGLILGINDGDLREVYRYLPSTLSAELLDWLSSAVKGGVAREAGLVFHGALARTSPGEWKAFDNYFLLEDAALAYHAEWPILTELNAALNINNEGAFSYDATGRILNSLVDGSVRVPFPLRGATDTIFIDATVAGPVQDAIGILNDTPVAAQVSYAAKDWLGTGSISGQLSLEVPVGPRSEEMPHTDISLQMDGNNLQFPDFDLEVLNVQGTIRYDTTTGLSAEKFTGVLFNEPVDGFIGSDLTGQSGEIIVNVIGKVDAGDLYRWSDQNLLTRAQGKGNYEAAVHIPFGGVADRTYVEATSDLRGIRLDLPEPLNKVADEDRLLYYRQEFLSPGYQVDMSIGDLQGSLYINDDILKGGELHFGKGTLARPDYDAIRITGELAYADYEEWDDFFLAMEEVSEASLENEMAQNVDSIVLDIRKLMLYSLDLDDVATVTTRSADSWEVFLANRTIQGHVSLSDDDSLPLTVALDYLRFDEEEGNPDPMAEVEPKDLGNIDFSTSELRYGDEDYGNWSFELRPDENGAQLNNLRADVRGLSVLEGSELSWRYDAGSHASTFKGRVTADDLGLALSEWGYASSIEGSDFLFQAELDWVGTPAAIDLDIVQGQLHVDKGKGRFVQVESGAGALKLLGIFDFAQIARRLRFDFSDVVDKGWSFNKVSGTASFNKGVINVVKPIVIEGSSNIFKVGGTVDLISGELDNDLVVRLPLSRNLPWYAAYSAIATGPLVGAGVILAQKVFEPQIDQMSSAKYKVSGTVDEPMIEFVSIFNDSVREGGEDEPSGQ